MRLIKDLIPEDAPQNAEAVLGAFNRLTDDAAKYLNEGWSAEEIFWSRYYWIRLYSNIMSATAGYDAGLEQSVFKVLEHPAPICAPDWQHGEEVDDLAQKEAKRWIRP
jgi:hypothetical protein